MSDIGVTNLSQHHTWTSSTARAGAASLSCRSGPWLTRGASPWSWRWTGILGWWRKRKEGIVCIYLSVFDIFVAHSRSRRGIWLTKRREESPRKVILDNLSKRKDVELFVWSQENKTNTMEIEIVSRNVSLSGIICYNILRSRENGASSSTLYSIEVL